MRDLNRQLLAGRGLVLLLLLAFALASVARADDSDPSVRVARLAHVQGAVSIQPAGLDDWAAADLNRPLTSGDKLWSDADSRAELSIGSAIVRLGSTTGFSFLNLDDHTAQMQVTAGTASVHVRTIAQNDTLEVDTPNSVVSLLGPGDYRIEVNEAGDTSVIKVSGGTAEVTAGGQDIPVHLQQQITVSGPPGVSAIVTALGEPDAFDAWTFERDRRTQLAQTTNYVSPEVVGADDLDQNGTWQPTPDDGYVWAPNSVAVGWAPYRDGHWAWISPWGWTWVDAAAWGFAPFHYGRWITFAGRWCWVPGARRQRPVYAPALVAWMSGAPLAAAPGFGGAAGVAWFALGPHEVYVPAYPASQSYVRSINVANTSANDAFIVNVYNHNVTDLHYVNRNAPGAITAVSQAIFTGAQPVARNAVRLRPNELAGATASAIAPAITPVTQSVLGAGATGDGVPRPPQALQKRSVLAKTDPPPAPAPFAAQQQAIHANGGRPIARFELTSLAVYAPAARVRMTASASGAESRSGIDRAARPNASVPRGGVSMQVPAWARPPPGPPEASLEPTARAPLTRQRDGEPLTRGDRPPTALGQPGMEERARVNDVVRPVEIRAPVVQDLNRHVDRPTAQASPVPSEAPAQAVNVPAPEPKAKVTAHAEKPARPAAHANN